MYGTSGPRIDLNFEMNPTPLSCEQDGEAAAVPMGSEFSIGHPHFRLTVAGDRVPLQKIEIIKGTLEDGIFKESVATLWEGSAPTKCLVWKAPNFVPAEPAFWYARVIEEETLRWSAHQCRKENRCDEFPGADAMIEERAWSSPIWYLPTAGHQTAVEH